MAEDKFLAFKGLKQYDPDSGWASVAPNENTAEHTDEYSDSFDHEHGQYQHLEDHGYGHSQDQNYNHSESLYIDPHFEKDLNDLSMDLSRNFESAQNTKKNPRTNSNSNPQHKQQEDINLSDPLLSELFEQLHQPPQDELTQNWKIIATSVNILSQRMAQRRDLQERLTKLDIELESLRSNILHDLEDIQKAADQQLSMARLRAEVSTLAQARLASRLKQKSN